jgi:Recombination endonuclease VII
MMTVMSNREIDVCRLCGVPKSTGRFGTYVAKSGPDTGRRKAKAICRDCENQKMRDWRTENADRHLNNDLNWRYGLGLEQYRQILAVQDGVCAVCHRPPAGLRSRLDVDHDHVTGEVRGLLCSPCNRALALVGDDPDRLEALITYLKAPKL